MRMEEREGGMTGREVEYMGGGREGGMTIRREEGRESIQDFLYIL